jgi:DNA N-6-adenine-methyltransferase (Dam)
MKGRDNIETSDHWETPDYFYNELNKEFNFDFDPCPLHSTFNALIIEWGKSNYINPPYNRVDKPAFIKKAYEESLKNKLCVMLLPASTSTKVFHELILPNAEVRFIKGRVAFKGINSKGEYSIKNKGKHDSMLVIFRGKDEKEYR